MAVRHMSFAEMTAAGGASYAAEVSEIIIRTWTDLPRTRIAKSAMPKLEVTFSGEPVLHGVLVDRCVTRPIDHCLIRRRVVRRVCRLCTSRRLGPV